MSTIPITKRGAELLKEELDLLEKEPILSQDDKEKPINGSIQSLFSFETLLSPTDESISMFSRQIEAEVSAVDKPIGDISSNKLTQEENFGEMWTLLDCHFGIPLFDVDANTKICDAIVLGDLCNASSLIHLTESSRKLGTSLLESEPLASFD